LEWKGLTGGFKVPGKRVSKVGLNQPWILTGLGKFPLRKNFPKERKGKGDWGLNRKVLEGIFNQNKTNKKATFPGKTGKGEPGALENLWEFVPSGLEGILKVDTILFGRLTLRKRLFKEPLFVWTRGFSGGQTIYSEVFSDQIHHQGPKVPLHIEFNLKYRVNSKDIREGLKPPGFWGWKPEGFRLPSFYRRLGSQFFKLEVCGTPSKKTEFWGCSRITFWLLPKGDLE